MIEFLKRFGMGILYVIISPFILIILLSFAIYNLFFFFVTLAKGVVSFFKGCEFFPPFPEDEKAKRILYARDGLDAEGKAIEPQPFYSKPQTNNLQDNSSPAEPMFRGNVITNETQFNDDTTDGLGDNDGNI